ncbi:murein DD-endopeptidase MepM/ murein hydrolase activator NlpD [Methylobacterium sp. BE186]|uniref:M23 family metallopeptidase n=1 Tax=Methylobacterium sp. BE186 TaxID=2817715 RepID=UPI00285E8C85|nr:M23 family metallopeptidase [Methylobacterium sp. BE186]MDR7036766.1 murein DD-endopeptidase MepM/ murein hydrolase activator NlpD [Methylobacterium sp. BE186]
MPLTFRAATSPLRAGRIALGIGLVVTTLWAAAATYVLVFHDTVLARFVERQVAMRAAYEARILDLQASLDRAATQRVADIDGVESRLSALTDRQAGLERRQAAIADLVGEDVPDPSRTGALPDAGPLDLELRPGDGGPGRRSARDAGIRLARLERTLDRFTEAQTRSLGRIAARAGRGAERLRNLVARTGLEPHRLERPAAGLGGPLVPVSGDPFALALAQAQRARGDEQRLRRIAADLPLRRPILGAFSLSSAFGTRLDPFTRGLALHTGLDLKAEFGEPARATASGHVTAAEPAGGYGNMVEIDHGHGVVTRYAHLARLAVTPGQWVRAGDVVGRVGSTGRSTGSHLHYETRIDGEPVDPQRFLRAGADLDAWQFNAP